jgi:hypothetical protein
MLFSHLDAPPTGLKITKKDNKHPNLDAYSITNMTRELLMLARRAAGVMRPGSAPKGTTPALIS